jgi:hypothetical protein
MFHVKHCTGSYVSILMYVHTDSNETTKTSYETGQGAAKRNENRGLGGCEEASAIPAGGVGGDVQAAKEAGDVAAGRRRAGVVPAGRAGVPDADQPGSAKDDDRGEKEGAGVKCGLRNIPALRFAIGRAIRGTGVAWTLLKFIS